MPASPAVPGSWRVAAGFLFSSICVPEKNTKTANTTPSAGPLMRANAPRLASAAPVTMPGARRRTRSQRTAPRL